MLLGLQSKLEALERKYGLQAARHDRLTNELNMLRRQTSLSDVDADTPVTSANASTQQQQQQQLNIVSTQVQTSPSNGEQPLQRWPSEQPHESDTLRQRSTAGH